MWGLYLRSLLEWFGRPKEKHIDDRPPPQPIENELIRPQNRRSQEEASFTFLISEPENPVYLVLAPSPPPLSLFSCLAPTKGRRRGRQCPQLAWPICRKTSCCLCYWKKRSVPPWNLAPPHRCIHHWTAETVRSRTSYTTASPFLHSLRCKPLK